MASKRKQCGAHNIITYFMYVIRGYSKMRDFSYCKEGARECDGDKPTTCFSLWFITTHFRPVNSECILLGKFSRRIWIPRFPGRSVVLACLVCWDAHFSFHFVQCNLCCVFRSGTVLTHANQQLTPTKVRWAWCLHQWVITNYFSVGKLLSHQLVCAMDRHLHISESIQLTVTIYGPDIALNYEVEKGMCQNISFSDWEN